MAKTANRWRIGLYIANDKKKRWRSKTIAYFNGTEKQAEKLLDADIGLIATVIDIGVKKRKAKDG